MTPGRQDPRRPLDAVTPSAGGSPARRSQNSGGRDHAAWRLVGLALLGHMLRSRRFYERLAFAAVVLAALSKQSKENRARAFARLGAWNKRQIQFIERKAEQEANRLERKAKQLERTAKGSLTTG